MRFFHTVFLLGILGVLYLPSALSASKSTNEIFYARDQLTAHLKGASLKEVLLAVAKVAKVEFTVNKALADKMVSVQFAELSLEKGIKKILRPFNHSMVYDSSGRPIKIIIIESGSRSTTETISKDHNVALSIGLNQKDVDPSLGPGGRLGEELPGGPAGGTEDLNPENFDPSLGPAGRLEEEFPEDSAEGLAGLGPDGEEMRIPIAGVDYDPAVGPTGRLEDVMPEITSGPDGFEDETTVLSGEEQLDPSLDPTGQPVDNLTENTIGPGVSLPENQGPDSSMGN